MTIVIALLMQVAIESPRDAFARAEVLYQEQRYAEAAEVYEGLRAAGVEDGALYYNLGNAYFKAGRIGLAILSYERASKLMPGDEDARVNLAYANELVTGAVEEPPLPLAIRWAVDFYHGLRVDFLAKLLSAVFIVGGVALSMVLYDAWPQWRTAAVVTLVVCVTFALVSGGTLAAKATARANRVEAIVLSENAYVRSGPGDASPRLAEVHEGLKVRVLSERSGWLQVRLANGLTGWIRASEVETI